MSTTGGGLCADQSLRHTPTHHWYRHACAMGHRFAFLPCIIVVWVVRARERVMVACLCSAVLQVQPAGAPCTGLRQRAGGDASLPALRAGGLPCGLRRRLCQVWPLVTRRRGANWLCLKVHAHPLIRAVSCLPISGPGKLLSRGCASRMLFAAKVQLLQLT